MISVDEVLLPLKPLTNLELMEAAEALGLPLRGVYMRNELPRRPKKDEMGILNLDDNDDLSDRYGTSTGEGTHWTCWYKRGPKKYYFDSFGLQPPKEILEYLGALDYNIAQIQTRGTVICGHLCLTVLKRLCDGMSFEQAIRSFPV